jgi:hypothetical protein
LRKLPANLTYHQENVTFSNVISKKNDLQGGGGL